MRNNNCLYLSGLTVSISDHVYISRFTVYDISILGVRSILHLLFRYPHPNPIRKTAINFPSLKTRKISTISVEWISKIKPFRPSRRSMAGNHQSLPLGMPTPPPPQNLHELSCKYFNAIRAILFNRYKSVFHWSIQLYDLLHDIWINTVLHTLNDKREEFEANRRKFTTDQGE